MFALYQCTPTLVYQCTQILVQNARVCIHHYGMATHIVYTIYYIIGFKVLSLVRVQFLRYAVSGKNWLRRTSATVVAFSSGTGKALKHFVKLSRAIGNVLVSINFRISIATCYSQADCWKKLTISTGNFILLSSCALKACKNVLIHWHGPKFLWATANTVLFHGSEILVFCLKMALEKKRASKFLTIAVIILGILRVHPL